MQMTRSDLLAKLSVIAPALADNNLLPILQHIWFTGDAVMAFNDQIAISVPMKSEFIGAVPGNVLLSLLKNSKARDVTLTENGDILEIKAASSRLKLATMPPESFLFEMPPPPKERLAVGSAAFLSGIESCLRSVGMDTSSPDQLGVTLVAGAAVLDLYATNNATISHARIKLEEAAKFDRVILSTAFCKQMLSMVDRNKPLQLAVFDDHAMLAAGNGQCLFGRLVESDRKLDFSQVLADHLPGTARKQMVPMPDKLKLVLERAVIITELAVDQGYTTITVRDGKTGGRVMHFHSKSDRGEVHDSVQVADQHPDVSVRLEPKLLKAGYDPGNRILITDRCAVIASGKGDSMIYLIATRSLH